MGKRIVNSPNSLNSVISQTKRDSKRRVREHYSNQLLLIHVVLSEHFCDYSVVFSIIQMIKHNHNESTTPILHLLVIPHAHTHTLDHESTQFDSSSDASTTLEEPER